jgi:hypothetical protein
VKPSKQLAADADAIRAFVEAYRRFCDLDPERSRRPVGLTAGDLRRFVEAAEQVRSDVNRAAGPAADAIDRAGFAMQIGAMQVNPVRSWRTAERYGSTLTQRAVADFAEQSEATLRHRAAAARAAERTLAGRAAAIVRFPSEVRDQVHSSSPVARGAAFSVAVVLEAAAGGVLTAGVLAGIKLLLAAISG